VAAYKRGCGGVSFVLILEFRIFDIMSTTELKIEIQKLISDASEHALTDALDILKKDHEQAEEARYAKNLEKIMADNRGLLQRLAQ